MRYLTSIALAGIAGMWILLSLAGCGQSHGNVVTGTVKMKNGDAVSGTIFFKGKTNSRQGPITNGKYVIEQVDAGPNGITISGNPGSAAPPAKTEKGPKMPEIDAGKGASMGVNPPDKYAKPGVLEFDVQSGKNEKDFILEP
jgi:hypothetical protein